MALPVSLLWPFHHRILSTSIFRGKISMNAVGERGFAFGTKGFGERERRFERKGPEDRDEKRNDWNRDEKKTDWNRNDDKKTDWNRNEKRNDWNRDEKR